MSNRTGTYVEFHANGQKEPTESDIKYFNLLKALESSRRQRLHFRKQPRKDRSDL